MGIKHFPTWEHAFHPKNRTHDTPAHPSPYPNTNWTGKKPPQLCNSIGLIPIETLFVSYYYESIQSSAHAQKHIDIHLYRHVNRTPIETQNIQLYAKLHNTLVGTSILKQACEKTILRYIIYLISSTFNINHEINTMEKQFRKNTKEIYTNKKEEAWDTRLSGTLMRPAGMLCSHVNGHQCRDKTSLCCFFWACHSVPSAHFSAQ